jgi:hypothetical protein
MKLMKNINNEQFEQDLKIVSNLNQVDAPDFFYTRLKARMEKEAKLEQFEGPLKPIAMICILTLFLFINSLIVGKESTVVQSSSNQDIEDFAASYDQIISN